jgi:hypothetical protein
MTSLISYDLSKWTKKKPMVRWRTIFQGVNLRVASDDL